MPDCDPQNGCQRTGVIAGVRRENRRVEDIQGVIVALRGRQVLVDADVAKLYGVETKEINRVRSRQNP